MPGPVQPGRMGHISVDAFLDTLHWFVAASYLLCLGYGVVSDVRRLIIPNGTCILIALMFLPAALLAGTEWPAIAWHYATGAGLLVVGIALFSRDLIGGGDAKLLAATGIWIGPGDLWTFVGLVAVLGGVLAGVILVAQKFQGTSTFLGAIPWLGHGDTKTQPTPYGVAIGLAAGYLFFENPVFPQAWAQVLG
ncbi:MAG: prepilin peptidase [Rhodospirillales bacterium]|nr:prepilin peptidase [Rhodospirillales bacterium]